MKEYRVAGIETSNVSPMTVVGVPVVFDRPALIHDPAGDYYEVIDRHALDNADLSDSTLITEHDSKRVPLARTPKTMQLTIEPDGLHLHAELADTATAHEVWTAIHRGDYRGLSFAFTVAEGGSSYDPSTNTRTITAVKRVYEISVVAHPAYEQTSVEARSQIQQGRDRMEKRRQALIMCNQIISD